MKPVAADNQDDCQECALYRHFAEDGTLLYVGISLNAVNRLVAHQSKPWARQIKKITVDWFLSRADAVSAEKMAINKEKPKFNIVWNSYPDDYEFTPESTLTATERKRREREKRRADGQVRIEAWIPAAAREAVEAAIQEALAAHQEKEP